MRLKQQCVYALKHLGEIIYIGTTNDLSARMCEHYRKCDSFYGKVKEKKNFFRKHRDEIEVEILYDKRDFKLEKELITKYKPRFNVSHVVKWSMNAPKRVIELNSGKQYSIMEAQRDLGINGNPTIPRSIQNNRAVYGKYRFEYI